MAGVRSNPQPNGKFVGWFMDMNGKQRFFAGTTKKAETEQMAARLEDEHRQIRLGYRPAPKSADKHRATPIQEVVAEYMAWGRSQGGRGGRPWSAEHARKRTDTLAWWVKQLGLTVLSDLDGVLPRVEQALRGLQEAKKAGKTLQIYREALGAFCHWGVTRGYLIDDPLKGSVSFDTTPKTVRRAMTVAEIQLLLTKCSPKHRLLYEVAFTSGLRAGELRALRVKNLDTERRGVYLDAAWTKNRKPGFQPLPTALVERLAEEAAGKAPDDPLLFVTRHPACAIKRDLKLAGIPRWTPEGKVDFHACRTAYVTLVLETGCSVKEAQSLARHATPNLTMNTYGRSRQDRLSELAEAVGNRLVPGPDYAQCRTRLAAGAEGMNINSPETQGFRAVSQWRAQEDLNLQPSAS